MFYHNKINKKEEVKRGYSQTKKGKEDGFYSSQAEDFKTGKQTLRKLWELLHLLEVEGTVRYIFETKDSMSQCHIDILYKVQQGYMVLLLLLSHFSRVRLCATPETAAHQAAPSLGFSRQEHWSGLPFPSPMHACMLSRFSCVRLCATLWTAAHQVPPSTVFSR